MEESKIGVAKYWTDILYIMAWFNVFLTLNITTCLDYPFRQKGVHLNTCILTMLGPFYT